MAATTVEFLYFDSRRNKRAARELIEWLAVLPAEGWVRAALEAS